MPRAQVFVVLLAIVFTAGENVVSTPKPKKVLDVIMDPVYIPPAEKRASFWRKSAHEVLNAKLKETVNTNKAKNGILFIGDGMSATVMAARTFAGQLEKELGEDNVLDFEKFPVSGLAREINQHKVRKELITMLEFYEGTHCKNCSLLKCKCAKTDKKSINTSGTLSNSTSVNKSTSNTEPNNEDEKVQIQLKADIEDKVKRDKNDLSPAPSTPERKTDVNDIEAWMEASKKEDSVAEKMVKNSKNSLVTIESVRPADLPLKILQKSCVLNPSKVLNCSNMLNSFKSSNIVHNGP